tara:strand:- start:57 stop:410 length:354 start_codon:yes stop_codon:yes gene_type:complete
MIEKPILELVVQSDALCGSESYQILYEKVNDKYIYWQVNLEAGEEYHRSEFFVAEKELTPNELRSKLDESSWLDLHLAIQQFDFENANQVIGNIVEIESEIIPREWLKEWIDNFLDQ